MASPRKEIQQVHYIANAPKEQRLARPTSAEALRPKKTMIDGNAIKYIPGNKLQVPAPIYFVT